MSLNNVLKNNQQKSLSVSWEAFLIRSVMTTLKDLFSCFKQYISLKNFKVISLMLKDVGFKLINNSGKSAYLSSEGLYFIEINVLLFSSIGL